MKCPSCGEEDLEVKGTIIKDFQGVFDDEGNLRTETTAEEITYIECLGCHKEIPTSMIKSWT